jgi:CRISPR-associated protein Cas1
LQADAKDSLKKRLRQEMVRRKILNQSAVLVAVGSDGAATLKEIARHVEPRDPDKVEARAARFYWSRLFTEFTRDDPADRRSKLLNYGYAVVRAGVARALVAAGLVPGARHRPPGRKQSVQSRRRCARAISTICRSYGMEDGRK